MKNKPFGILVCGILLALLLPTIPIGTALRTENEVETCSLFERTTIRGFAMYLGKDATGRFTRLFALRLTYHSISLSGERERGVIHMRNIHVPARMTGYIGNLYIAASFRGPLTL